MTSAALLATSVAIVTVAAACLAVGKATARLRADLDELKAPRDAPRPDGAESGRATHRMMSALYPERTGALVALSGIPAWPALAAGAGLAIVGLVLGLLSAAPAAPAASADAPQVQALRHAIDSLGGEVRRVTDSLRATPPAGLRAAAAAAGRPARPAPAPRPSSPLPPPPSLQPVSAAAPGAP